MGLDVFLERSGSATEQQYANFIYATQNAPRHVDARGLFLHQMSFGCN